jgi:hypothetical protein
MRINYGLFVYFLLGAFMAPVLKESWPIGIAVATAVLLSTLRRAG